jgi:hypothetical protein
MNIIIEWASSITSAEKKPNEMWRETSVPASPKTAAAMRPGDAEADCGEERLSQDTQYVRYAPTRSTVGVHRGVDDAAAKRDS